MRTLRRIAAITTLAAITLGIPLVLAAIGRWPLPTRLPNWTNVRVAIQQGNLPATVVLKTLATIGWITWAQLAWATTWEIATQLRHPHHAPAVRPAPLVPRAVHSSIGRLVAVAFAATIVITTTPIRAFATRPAPVATTGPPPPTRAPVVTPAERATPAPSWTVAAGDTVWDIAETALGDGARSSEILELNNLHSPRHLRVGQQLRLPTDATIPTDRQPAPEPVEPADYQPATTVTIQPGDDLWTIAAHRLDNTDGPHRQPTAPEIVAYIDQIATQNTIPSGRASLVHPGEEYTLPAIGQPPAATKPPAADDQADARQPAAPAPTAVPEAPADPTPVAPTPITLPPPQAPAASVPSTARATPAGPATPIAPAAQPPESSNLFAELAGATVLATGLLLAYRHRRQLAARTGTRHLHRRPLGPAADTIDALTRAADVPLIRRANHTLATLMNGLRPDQITGTPLLVELSTEHGIEILWTTPEPDAPTPWRPADGGWTWHHTYDPDQPLTTTPDTPPIAGLATIGTRHGNLVLANLEALGTIAITGDPTRTTNLTRSIALELAANDELANACITTVGLDIDTPDRLWRAEHTDTTHARQRLHDAIASYDALLAATGLPDAFHSRLHGNAGDREVTIIATNPTDATDILDDLEIPPNHGVAVIITGPNHRAAATIDIDPTGRATLRPAGLEFHAAGLAATVAERILADDEPPAPPDTVWFHPVAEPAPLIVHAVAADADGDANEFGDQDDEDGDWTPPQPAHLIRVLGVPRIDGFDRIGPLELGIATFLACNGGRATPDQIKDAVWNGKRIEHGTFTNRLTKTRQALPGFLLGRTQQELDVELAPGITSDLTLMHELVAHAERASATRACELLHEALSYVSGPPFDATGYDWAHVRQDHAAASTLIERAALGLTELALEASDINLARTACRTGLIGLPLNEPLYVARMRVEAAAHNPAGITAVFNELTTALRELSDSFGQLEPDPETVAEYEQLRSRQPARRPA